jgi:hypothetical protein
MHPVKFDNANTDLVKPEDMDDDQCLSLPAEQGIDDQGFPYFLTAWQPNREDIEALKNGRPLFIKIFGNSHPPIGLFTVDENNEGNF